MFIRLFAVLAIAAVSSAAISSLNDLYVKDIDGLTKYFEHTEGRCHLLVITATGHPLAKSTMKWLMHVAKDNGPKLDINAIPTNSFGNEPLDGDDLADWLDVYVVFSDILAMTDVKESEMVEFLARQSGVHPNGDFYKYLVWKDGVTVTPYDERAGPVESEKINHDIQNCMRS